jgi:CRISPR-associated protein Csx16
MLRRSRLLFSIVDADDADIAGCAARVFAWRGGAATHRREEGWMNDSVSSPASAATARTRLVGFLGTGCYKPARHRFPDHSIGSETPYICRALAEFVHADEIALIATAEARAKHEAPLAAELRAANLPAAQFHPIPMGESEAELWRQFETVKDLLRPPSGTAVALEVTHAFRSQPFFAAAVAAFVRAVERAPAPLKVFYAAFEARRDGVAPVWELTPFVDLLDWAQGMMLFLRTGRAADIAERTIALGQQLRRQWAASKEGAPPNLEQLGKALRDFGGNLETVRTGDLLLGRSAGSALDMAAALAAARESAHRVPPLADVLDRLRDEMIVPLLGARDHLANPDGHRALAALARLYVGMGRWAEAAAVAREGWITRHAMPAAAFGERRQNRPGLDEGLRRNAEDRWGREEGDVARAVAAVRNDIEHAGFKQQPLPAASLRGQIGKLVERFAALPPARRLPPAAPAVFVNLSNHPSSAWSAAQREAALNLAPQIQDWPFPPVPPEAGPADIAALAERTVAQLTEDLPAATHAMVQGEFTLTHALVRALQRRGIVCLAATTRRQVLDDCGAVKTTRFEFVRFREYG